MHWALFRVIQTSPTRAFAPLACFQTLEQLSFFLRETISFTCRANYVPVMLEMVCNRTTVETCCFLLLLATFAPVTLAANVTALALRHPEHGSDCIFFAPGAGQILCGKWESNIFCFWMCIGSVNWPRRARVA